MSGEPKTLTQMTPREAWEHAWEQAIDACRVFEEEAAAKQLEAVRNLGRQMLDQDQEEEGVPVVARDEAAELRAALERIADWPDGGNLYGQANIKRFAADTLRRLAGGEAS